jgi:hypothetical protein
MMICWQKRTSRPGKGLQRSIPYAALHGTSSNRQVEEGGVAAVVRDVAMHHILTGDEQLGVVRVGAATAAAAAAAAVARGTAQQM